jgi:hypothetical protein
MDSAWPCVSRDTPSSLVPQSLLSGRPSLLNLRQINCRFPEDRESVTINGEVEIGCMLLAPDINPR